MEATTEERNLQAQLNQARARLTTLQNDEESQRSGPAAIVHAGEVIIVLGVAIIADIIDALDLTGIGAIVARLIDIPMLGILWLWRILKHQPGPKKDPTIKLLSAFLVEVSPIGIVPTWTVFVAFTYFQETRYFKKTVGRVQKKFSKFKKIKEN